MTGGTLLVKKNGKFVLTKVAHDGFDLKELKTQFKNWMNNPSSPEDVVKSYLLHRHQLGHGDFDVFEVDLPTEIDRCFYTKIFEVNTTFDEAFEKMRNELMAISEDDDDIPEAQLACSYCDYVLYVDLDKNKMNLNGEDVQ